MNKMYLVMDHGSQELDVGLPHQDGDSFMLYFAQFETGRRRYFILETDDGNSITKISERRESNDVTQFPPFELDTEIGHIKVEVLTDFKSTDIWIYF